MQFLGSKNHVKKEGKQRDRKNATLTGLTCGRPKKRCTSEAASEKQKKGKGGKGKDAHSGKACLTCAQARKSGSWTAKETTGPLNRRAKLRWGGRECDKWASKRSGSVLYRKVGEEQKRKKQAGAGSYSGATV